MLAVLLALLAACHLALGAQQQAGAFLHPRRSTQPPSWPKSYSASYTFSLPYTGVMQPDMVSYHVAFHRDASKKHPRIRMDTLNGTNVLIAGGNAQYLLTPRLDRQVCAVSADSEEIEDNASLTVLPDLSGWESGGLVEFGGKEVQLWQYEQRHEAKHVLYRFYVAPDGRPLRLHLHGNNLDGAHFDEWVVDYLEFTPNPDFDAALFSKPSICGDDASGAAKLTKISSATAGALRMARLAPAVRYGGEDPGYDAFLTTHGRARRHVSLAEYTNRLKIFRKNAAKIASHNAKPERTFALAMNRFGDWTKDEFLAVMLPRHGKKASLLRENDNGARELGKHELPYEPAVDPSLVPTAVDWRGTGADTGVKDQADCGSCWAFGAAGTLESAWFLATGVSASLSEQQIIDCAWGYVPEAEESASACDGGDAWAGVGHIIDAGGIAALNDYQYLGQNDYCREVNVTAFAAKFKGYVRIPKYDEAALREAVYSRGSVTVSMDASQDSFTFYSHGVYYDTECMYKPSDLDHSMLLVGYGSEEAGDYWLIRNSWSTHWGDGGYVKVARDNHGCGAATDAMYAVADAEAAAAAKRQRQRKQ